MAVHDEITTHATPATPRHETPERRLMRAVLDDALRVAFAAQHSSRTSCRRLRRETAEWFASDDRQWPFSFRNVCDVLGLAAERIRGEVGYAASRAA